MQVKIYTKDSAILTSLLKVDVEALEFTDKEKGDGSATFMIRADSAKATQTTLAMYNLIKIYDGTVCKFFGFIADATYTLSTVKVTANSIGYLLKNRTLGNSYVANGTLLAIVTDMVTQLNAGGFTGISIGSITGITGTFNKTYTSGESIDAMIRDLIGSDSQFRVDANGLIQIAPLLGNDLSQSVQLKYNVNQAENATIVNFTVKESGQSIITQIQAKRTGGSLVVSDTNLITKYGLVQTTKTYPTAVDDPQLIVQATKDLSGSLFAPELTLTVNAKDNFNVCDFLGISIYNKIIDIKKVYQVIEKQTIVVGDEKKIVVKVNDKQKDLADILLEQRERIKLLENKN